MEQEMKTNAQGNNEQKLSYEQLNEACAQLYQQNQNLLRQLQQANMTNMFKRLDYLFMVVKYKEAFRKPFVENVVMEIEEALTVTREEEKEDSKEKEG